LEIVTDEKLTHMLSIQKCPTDKTRFGYVAFTSDIPSSSKTVFVKPTVPEGEVLTIAQPFQKPPTRRKPHTCHHCGVSGHIRSRCPQRQAQNELSRHASSRSRPPICHHCGVLFAVIFDLGVLSIRLQKIYLDILDPL
jgi:hypothetical protein